MNTAVLITLIICATLIALTVISSNASKRKQKDAEEHLTKFFDKFKED